MVLGLVGAEALVRWQHEDGRIVSRRGISSRCLKKMVLSPRWIPMCLGRACSQLSRVDGKREGSPFRISVNLSSVDIASEQLIPQILEITPGLRPGPPIPGI